MFSNSFFNASYDSKQHSAGSQILSPLMPPLQHCGHPHVPVLPALPMELSCHCGPTTCSLVHAHTTLGAHALTSCVQAKVFKQRMPGVQVLDIQMVANVTSAEGGLATFRDLRVSLR